VLALMAHPDDYICASEGNMCDCTGMVSYGYGPVWTTNGVMGSQLCANEAFGDPLRGVEKYCVCNPSTQISETCAGEGGYCTCDNGYVWFGALSSWVKKETKGSTDCSNSVFGDPIEGVSKSCICDINIYLDFSNGRAATLSMEGAPDEDLSEQCAVEGGYCDCQSGHVWYGEGSSWFKKVLIGGAECNNNVLGDPIHLKKKKCMCVEHVSSLDDEAVAAVHVPITCELDGRVIVSCADEGDFCSCDGGYIFYGEMSSWIKTEIMGSAQCTSKKCLCAELL